MNDRWKRGRSRGRPMERFNAYHDLRSLASIAEQYGIPLKQFVASVTKAWRHQNSQCDLLQIHRRGNYTSDEITFLITKGTRVISQFSINVSLLRNPDYYIDR